MWVGVLSHRVQFITEDPTFLAVGDPIQLKQLTGKDQQAFLSDPQQMNSTSYGRDNPITNKDPQGTCPICAPVIMAAIEAYGAFTLGYSGGEVLNTTMLYRMITQRMTEIRHSLISV
jgi:hypothetical protein